MKYIISEYRPWEIKNFSHIRAGKGYLKYYSSLWGVAYWMFHKGNLYRALPLSTATMKRSEVRRVEKDIKLMVRQYDLSKIKNLIEKREWREVSFTFKE
jgi:hypothetical protein